jgi:hypothetical protein
MQQPQQQIFVRIAVLTSSALRLAQLATEMSEPVPLTLLLHDELDRHDTLRMR